MKTITEFNAVQLKKAIESEGSLTAAGKNPEEVTQALGETLKMEGDKLKYFRNAMEIAKQRPQGLKRVIVMTVGENEKAPSRAEKKDEQYYLAEFFPLPPEKQRERHDGRRGEERGDKRRGKRRGRHERGDRRGPRSAEGAPGEGHGRRIEGQAASHEGAPAGGAEKAGAGEGQGERRRRRRWRGPRKPRPEGVTAGAPTATTTAAASASAPAPAGSEGQNPAPASASEKKPEGQG